MTLIRKLIATRSEPMVRVTFLVLTLWLLAQVAWRIATDGLMQFIGTVVLSFLVYRIYRAMSEML